MEVASEKVNIKKFNVGRIHADIDAMKRRQLSDRVLSILHMIESNIDGASEYDDGLLKVLYGKDFGMVFNCIGYDAKSGKWVVVKRNGDQGILFDSLVDTIWFVRSIYRPLEEGLFSSPY